MGHWSFRGIWVLSGGGGLRVLTFGFGCGLLSPWAFLSLLSYLFPLPPWLQEGREGAENWAGGLVLFWRFIPSAQWGNPSDAEAVGSGATPQPLVGP